MTSGQFKIAKTFESVETDGMYTLCLSFSWNPSTPFELNLHWRMELAFYVASNNCSWYDLLAVVACLRGTSATKTASTMRTSSRLATKIAYLT